jgi:hypothetical protein
VCSVCQIWTTDTPLCATVCKGYIFAGLMNGVCEVYSIRNGGRSAFRYIVQRCPIRSITCFPNPSSIKIVSGGQDGLIRQVRSQRGAGRVPMWRMVSLTGGVAVTSRKVSMVSLTGGVAWLVSVLAVPRAARHVDGAVEGPHRPVLRRPTRAGAWNGRPMSCPRGAVRARHMSGVGSPRL